MRGFGYHRAGTVAEAIALLGELGPGTAVLAGGTDLLLKIKQQHAKPAHLVDIASLTALRSASTENGFASFGPLHTVAAVEKDDFFAGSLPVLSRAAASLGSPQIRNLATVGGNLCNAAPSAELAPPLLVLDAEVTLSAASGVARTVPLTDFFTGPGETLRRPDELLTRVRALRAKTARYTAYLRFTRRAATDIAVASAALRIDLDPATRTVAAARIALGAVSPTPQRALLAEQPLLGEPLTLTGCKEAARVASQLCCSPITDLRATCDYRRDLVRVLVRRGLEEIMLAARGDRGGETR